MSKQTLSILMPAFNESRTIVSTLKRVTAAPLPYRIGKEIIIVDDCSTDDTCEKVQSIAQSLQDENIKIRLLRHRKNQGKGMAIRTALKEVSGEYVIIQDADSEYEPCDYKPLLQLLIDNNLPVIYGSRFLNPQNKHSYQRYYWGGWFVTKITNLLYGLKLTDEPTCYKLFRADLIQSIPLKCTGFEFCPEITAKIAKKGIDIKEIPIHYEPRKMEEGKKIRWTDGIEAILTLIKYRFKA